jgi:hypothetical protein
MIKWYIECVGPCIAGLGVIKGSHLTNRMNKLNNNDSGKAPPTVYCFLPSIYVFFRTGHKPFYDQSGNILIHLEHVRLQLLLIMHLGIFVM